MRFFSEKDERAEGMVAEWIRRGSGFIEGGRDSLERRRMAKAQRQAEPHCEYRRPRGRRRSDPG